MVARKLKNINTNSLPSNSNDNAVSSIAQLEVMAAPLWGGQLNHSSNELVQKITNTFNYDKRFYSIAIDSIKAQLRMNVKREAIPDTHGKKLIEALDQIKKEFSEGKSSFDGNIKNIYEHIHSRVNALAGASVDYFNVARSNTNQSAGDFRLWVREAYDKIDSSLQNLQAALIDKSEETVKTIFPVTTNGQLTQPSSLGHYLMAFVEMFARDRSRIKDNRKRMNESPYASGDAVGNSFNLNREMVSRILGFDKACNNSIDAISDRDFAFDFMSLAAISSIHLSRLAQDLISWHGTQNSYISFPNEFVNQSEVIPYRRDPEALTAIRGKSSQALGALAGVASAMKNLSLEFSNDYSEICNPVIESYDTLLNSINAMSVLISNFTINRKQMKEAASQSFSTALDLVDWLIQNTGANYKQAQAKSRQLIEFAIKKGKKLSLLELDEIKSVEPKANDDIYSVLIPSRAIISRRSGNGSNPVQIRKAIRAARRNHL